MVSDDAAGEDREAHPGPPSAAMPRGIADAIVAQARAEYPNEACGIVTGTAPAGAGGEALAYEACRNRAASPYRYEIHADDLYRIHVAAEDEDRVFWAIVHSHVRSPAVPSPTDVGLALYPDALYVLVSLAADIAGPDGEPPLRAWRIAGGVVHEVSLAIT